MNFPGPQVCYLISKTKVSCKRKCHGMDFIAKVDQSVRITHKELDGVENICNTLKRIVVRVF